MGAVHMTMGTHGVQTVVDLAAGARSGGADAPRRPGTRSPRRRGRREAGDRDRRPEQALALAAPLFEVIGRRVFHAGPRPESATAIKLANNLMLGCAIEVMGEAFSLVRKFGVEPAIFNDVLVDGSSPPGTPGLRQDHRRGVLRERRLHRGSRAQGREPRAGRGRFRAAAAASVNAWRDRLLSAIAHGNGASTGPSSRASRLRPAAWTDGPLRSTHSTW